MPKPEKAGKGKAGFEYQVPGRDEAEQFSNPGEFWKAIREETGQNPDEFAQGQGYEDSDAFLASVRPEASEDDDEDDEDEDATTA